MGSRAGRRRPHDLGGPGIRGTGDAEGRHDKEEPREERPGPADALGATRGERGATESADAPWARHGAMSRGGQLNISPIK